MRGEEAKEMTTRSAFPESSLRGERRRSIAARGCESEAEAARACVAALLPKISMFFRPRARNAKCKVAGGHAQLQTHGAVTRRLPFSLRVAACCDWPSWWIAGLAEDRETRNQGGLGASSLRLRSGRTLASFGRPKERWRRAPRCPLHTALSGCALCVLGLFSLVLGCSSGRKVRVEVLLAEREPVAGYIEVNVGENGEVLYCEPSPYITNADLVRAFVQPDSAMTFCVCVELTPSASARIRRMTREHIGKPVVVLLDGEVALVADIKSTIWDYMCISSGMTLKEARDLSRRL